MRMESKNVMLHVVNSSVDKAGTKWTNISLLGDNSVFDLSLRDPEDQKVDKLNTLRGKYCDVVFEVTQYGKKTTSYQIVEIKQSTTK